MTTKELTTIEAGKIVYSYDKCGTSKAYKAGIVRIDNRFTMRTTFVVLTRQGLTDGAFSTFGNLGVAYEGKEGIQKKTFKTASAAVKCFNLLSA